MKVDNNILSEITDADIVKGKFVIPDSVTSIGDYAFYECESLTEISIPNSVTSIGDYAFYGCESLVKFSVPNSVTSIGNFAFRWCISLTEISIPNSVISIGDSAFRYCKSLTEITIPNSVTSIGDSAFNGCKSLTEVFYKGKTLKTKCIDGYLMEILSEKSKDDYKIYRCKYFNTEKFCYAVEEDNVFSHGDSVKEAIEDLIYKVSDRDTSKYESLAVDSTLTFEKTIKMYRTITGACSNGTKYFVENNKDKVKESYKISEIVYLTEGQFGNDKLVEFFKK